MTQELKSEIIIPENYGLIKTKLPNSVMDRLWEYERVAREKNVSHSNSLAGNIINSLLLNDVDDWFYNNIILPQMELYAKTFPTYFKELNKIVKTDIYGFMHDIFSMLSLWINYQYKHEFNPVHHHGGQFSFVIWMKIPTNSTEQHNLEFVKHSNSSCASDFHFYHTNILGERMTSPIDMNPDMEGWMLFFPAKLQHQVYPFYISDDVRVSISGNIGLNL